MSHYALRYSLPLFAIFAPRASFTLLYSGFFVSFTRLRIRIEDISCSSITCAECPISADVMGRTMSEDCHYNDVQWNDWGNEARQGKHWYASKSMCNTLRCHCPGMNRAQRSTRFVRKNSPSSSSGALWRLTRNGLCKPSLRNQRSLSTNARCQTSGVMKARNHERRRMLIIVSSTTLNNSIYLFTRICNEDNGKNLT